MHKQTSFFTFISLFEKRALNLLIRAGISPNPLVSKFLFYLNCVNSSFGLVKNPNIILKPGLILMIRPSFIPYSLYRYYINYWRASYIIKEFNTFEHYRLHSLSKIRNWNKLIKVIIAKRVIQVRTLWIKNLNWSWKFLQILPKAAMCCLVRTPLKEDFSGFIMRLHFSYYRRLFQIS